MRSYIVNEFDSLQQCNTFIEAVDAIAEQKALIKDIYDTKTQTFRSVRVHRCIRRYRDAEGKPTIFKNGKIRVVVIET